MISIHNLSKCFGAFRALDDVSMELTLGNAYALIGPNGSGKTTLIKSILGMVVPSAGNIAVDGIDIAKSWHYRQKVGYMPQIGRYPENMKIRQVISMIKDVRGGNAPMDEELIENFRLEQIFEKRMHSLSGGTRQKVSAALAFLFSPPILILDEPTAGLDPVSVELLKEKIQRESKKGKLIMISSHVLSDLDDLANHALYLYEGQVLYNNSIDALKSETGEQRLGKAIAKLITTQFQNH